MTVDVAVIGTGEYATGFVHGAAARSDKGAGVVALTLLDLRRRGKVGRVALCGRDGERLPALRAHLQAAVAAPYGLDASVETFPADGVVDPRAYEAALDTLAPGGAAVVVVPDDLHLAVALAAVERGLHVLVAKPLVQRLEEHRRLLAAARRRGVLVMVEVHKRFDPIYADARERLRGFGDLSLFTSYMSQPKLQLDTFRAWAGRASDISYYLNAHHVDLCAWFVEGRARPTRVTAAAAAGVATPLLGRPTEDAITLTAQWEHLASGAVGVSVHTASWIAPPADVHSQQRFFAMGHRGEVRVDQAHRGYTVASDEAGFASANPLFMRYAPAEGAFAGQHGYGYRCIEAFVDAAADLNRGAVTPGDLDRRLPTAGTTLPTTAVLEAGRRSLDQGGRPIQVVYAPDAPWTPVDLA